MKINSNSLFNFVLIPKKRENIFEINHTKSHTNKFLIKLVFTPKPNTGG